MGSDLDETTGEREVESPGSSPSDELLREIARIDDAPRASDLVGTRLGRFRVVELLGRGGMGVVYHAVDETLRRDVALKVLPPDFSHDEERRRRFLREARSAAAMSHPCLATVHEVGEDLGRIFIAMELLRGKSLAAVLAERRLSVAEALRIAGRILEGVGKAHEAGLVHRDLKPDNVMLTDEGAVKVLDFGLAKPEEQTTPDGALAHTETASRLTTEGRIVGTPSYMSPEQARGEAVDRRSDVFSCGVMLYEMLTGQRPFAGRTGVDVISAILRDEPETVSKRNPEASSEISRIVGRCLAKEARERYGDCQSLASDLERALTGAGAPPVRRRKRRWAVGASLALALAGLGFVLLRTKAPGVAPLPSVSAAPANVITDLPLPPSKSPEAVAEYAAALEALRDARQGLALKHLRRAVAIDPSLAAAHLRLAWLLDGSRAEARTEFELALQGRASLSERDQAFLHVEEAFLGRDPTDASLTLERIREATRQFPLDAEIFLLLAFWESWSEPEAQLAAATRASELDPLSAVSWLGRALALERLGRMDESLAAFARCVEISHGSPDCLAGRAAHHGFHGLCAAMEEDARGAIAGGPSVLSELYALRAKALHALGRPEETVLEVLAQKWALLPEETRRTAELEDRAALAFDRGDFTRAAALLHDANRLSSASPEAVRHHNAAQWVGVLVEMGRPRDAADVAAEYLKRVDAWRSSVEYGDTMCMLRAMLHAGTLSPKAFSEKRASWLQQARPVFGSSYTAELWAETYGVHVETPEEASTPEEAKEALSTLSSVPRHRIDPATPTSLPLGEVYALAGRPDDALPFLRREARSCFRLGSPVNARNSYYLGLALEQKGDKPSACDAYAAMLARWGSATPRSVTADKARERARALGCPR